MSYVRSESRLFLPTVTITMDLEYSGHSDQNRHVARRAIPGDGTSNNIFVPAETSNF